MNTMVTILAAEELRERHAALLRGNPGLAMRECARQLGVREVELVAAECGVQATELPLAPARLLPLLATLGEVRVVTGNGGCEQERSGRYAVTEVVGSVALVRGAEIDLLLFLSHWGSCYAVSENGRHSLRCFDKSGDAVHVIRITERSDLPAYQDLVRLHGRRRGQMPSVQPLRLLPDAAVVRDPEALRRHWLGLRHPDEFQGMLRRLRVSRLAALQAATPDLAQEVDLCAITHALKIAAGTQMPVQCRVGNRAVMQVHTGPVARVRRQGAWFGICDERHALQLNTETVDSVWVVNKPSPEGWVSVLEAYAGGGEPIVQIAAGRGPGESEPPAWRELMRGLCAEPLAG